ncbi:MAG: APC family permease [Rubripirellula sp.]
MSDPKPTLDLVSATTIVIASMIGVGVYTTSGYTLAALQDPGLVVLAWAVGGLIAICGAIGYSSLATRFQESGGEYLFLTKTLHPAAGIMAGWVSMLAGFTGAIAAAAIGVEEYVTPMILSPEGSFSLPNHVLAISTVALAGTLHCLGVHLAARVQDAIVLFKLIMLAALIVLAISKMNSTIASSIAATNLAAPRFDLLAFAKQLVWISFSYAGFNAAIYISGEVIEARRNVPRAMILATTLVTILYVLLNAIFVFSGTPQEIISSDNLSQIAAVAAQAVGGSGMTTFVRLVIVVSLFTSVSALVMTGPRVYAKMADDGVLPSFFSFQKTAPTAAIIFQCLAAISVISISTLGELLGYLGLTLSLCSALTVGSIFFSQDPSAVAGKKWIRKLSNLAAIFYVTATLILAFLYGMGEVINNDRPHSVIAAACTLSLGWIWFAIVKHRQKARNPDDRAKRSQQ